MSKLTDIQEKIGVRVCDLFSAHHSDSPICFAQRIEHDYVISRLIEQAYNYGWDEIKEILGESITRKDLTL